MSKTVLRGRARRDLVEIFRYLARKGGLRVAQRFLARAESTFARLSRMPGTGADFQHDHPALAGLRISAVARFRKYLVFFRAVPDGVEIVRVLHGARDIAAILAERDDSDADPDGDETTESSGPS